MHDWSNRECYLLFVTETRVLRTRIHCAHAWALFTNLYKRKPRDVHKLDSYLEDALFLPKIVARNVTLAVYSYGEMRKSWFLTQCEVFVKSW